ncbi:MAG: hypothetical protein HY062_17465 [Bacteroidetes bacterium]|nr:hypothetical protein [Bacteroidota bacterium]
MEFQVNRSVVVLLIAFMIPSVYLKAQEYEPSVQDTSAQQTYVQGKGFHLGLYIGAYWANRGTAYIYDGYGFDQNGQRNSFGNSILYNQIVNVYGGNNGGTDYIAQLLNVNHGDWYFNEQDMPINLKYTTTYLVGLNMRYQINKKAGILLNINGTKLVVNGKFTISSTAGNSGGFQNSQPTVNQFTIVGAEQRLMFQLGYQRIIGNNEKLNLLVEAGVNFSLAKAQKNQAVLNSSNPNNSQNNITIDLMSIYHQPPYNYYSAKYLIGGGIGAIGGIGMHLTINPRYTIQLLYSPSYDRIGIGYNPKFKLQHGVGLRVYYNMS